jgi:hypothetical protein
MNKTASNMIVAFITTRDIGVLWKRVKIETRVEQPEEESRGIVPDGWSV